MPCIALRSIRAPSLSLPGIDEVMGSAPGRRRAIGLEHAPDGDVTARASVSLNNDHFLTLQSFTFFLHPLAK
jgi:hypothetical protein